MPDFSVKIAFVYSVCVRVYVHVSTPEAINNYWHDVAWYGPYMIG